MPDNSHPVTSRRLLRLARSTLLVSALVLGPALTGTANAEQAPLSDSSDSPTIDVLSGRADTITGGDALIGIDLPAGTTAGDVRVLAGGTDQSAAFESDPEGQALSGVVTDLPLGNSEIRVASIGPEDRTLATLSVTNYPQEGPVFSGPHEKPFICETQAALQPVSNESLGEPLDENCSIADRVDYFYQDTSAKFVPWPGGEEATAYPEDVRFYTGPSGGRTPIIIRMETSTMNRAIFRTTVLHDPVAEEAPSPTIRPRNWNGGAILMLSGGCPGGAHRQGSRTGEVTNSFMLFEGYALMSSSLNVFGNNCNDLLAAESAMMVKEEFSERYGAPNHLISFGGSGASYQSLQIADNYPGIIDGLIISDTFPDVGFATTNYVTDAKLLRRYFESTEMDWSPEQRLAVAGFNSYDILTNISSDDRTNPTAYCDHVPAELRYHPTNNPLGARCDIFSHTSNVYGTDPETGLPLRPMDNVGVEYGLAALAEGSITVDQFLDLNEHVGGFDHDANVVPERSVGSTDAIRAAYRTGRLTSGGGGLAEVPIIDLRTYRDETAGGDIHVRYHSLSLRQRLLDANGTVANLVSRLGDPTTPEFSRPAITGLSQWLRDIAADDSEVTQFEKVVAHRPTDFVDGCYLRDGSNAFVEDPLDRDPGSICEQLYPSGSFPREVAGDSVAASVAKCQVTTPDRRSYPVDFTDEQWARLIEVFDEGTCDYSVPGIEQQDLAGTWLQFDANGWAPMPEPPVSVPGQDPDPGMPEDWSAGHVYTAGDLVLFDGCIWEATWWTRGEHPGADLQGPWQEIVIAEDGTDVWTPSRIFTAGDIVQHDGALYEARWWTRNEEPGSPTGPWAPHG